MFRMGMSGVFRARGGIFLGMDIGASKVEWMVCPERAAGREGTARTNAGITRAGRTALAKNCDEKKLLEIVSARADENRPRATGLSLPGFVVGGRVVGLPNLANVDCAAFAAGLARLRRAGMRLTVENDVKCMALAEWAARGRKSGDDFLLVAPGSGIGTGIVREGRLVRGAHNTAGEAGHARMAFGGMGRAGPEGRLAEWEALCSGFGIERRWKERKKTAKSAKEIFASTDPFAKKIAKDGAFAFGLGLANLAAILDPAEIIVAGSVGKAYMQKRKLRTIMQKTFEKNAIMPVRNTPIRLSGLRRPALDGAWLLAQAERDGAAARFLA